MNYAWPFFLFVFMLIVIFFAICGHFLSSSWKGILTKPPCLCPSVILFCSRRTKSNRKCPSAVWSDKRVQENRSHDRGVFPMGKVFFGASGLHVDPELKVSFPYLQTAETKSACFALAGVPAGIPLGCGLWLQLLLLEMLSVLYFTQRANESQGENCLEVYNSHNCDYESQKIINVSSVL